MGLGNSSLPREREWEKKGGMNKKNDRVFSSCTQQIEINQTIKRILGLAEHIFGIIFLTFFFFFF
jgi:hypothetical protein